MKTFWIRTVSAVVYVLLFLGSMFSGVLLGNEKVGMLIFGAFLLFVTIGCSFEFFRMVRLQGACPSELLGYFYAILTLLLVMFVPLMGLKGFSVTTSTVSWALLLRRRCHTDWSLCDDHPMVARS